MCIRDRKRLVGRRLAARVLKSWIEDFVDEENGVWDEGEELFDVGNEIWDEGEDFNDIDECEKTGEICYNNECVPYEECHEMLKPDLIVKDFTELSNTLTKKEDSYAHRN